MTRWCFSGKRGPSGLLVMLVWAAVVGLNPAGGEDAAPTRSPAAVWAAQLDDPLPLNKPAGFGTGSTERPFGPRHSLTVGAATSTSGGTEMFSLMGFRASRNLGVSLYRAGSPAEFFSNPTRPGGLTGMTGMGLEYSFPAMNPGLSLRVQVLRGQGSVRSPFLTDPLGPSLFQTGQSLFP